ncbi:MAG: hypothetical protein R6U68_10475, partial [Desulfobacteraceae bacterium]
VLIKRDGELITVIIGYFHLKSDFEANTSFGIVARFQRAVVFSRFYLGRCPRLCCFAPLAQISSLRRVSCLFHVQLGYFNGHGGLPQTMVQNAFVVGSRHLAVSC